MPTPRKRFGQHFLSDQDIVFRIVAALNPKNTEHLVEIGPGQGALTVEVLKKTKYLEVIELDRDLVPVLLERTRPFGELMVENVDVLDFDFAGLQNDQRKLRVFGNLPYNISTPLIFHLLHASHVILDMLFMLQKEVALRLIAGANDAHYGRLSVMVQYQAAVAHLFDVSPQAFYPPPQVQSSIVQITPYETLPYQAKDFDLFATIVKEAFGMRRKTLRNSLKKIIDDTLWAQLPITSDLRPESLSVKDFVDLSNAVYEHGLAKKG